MQTIVYCFQTNKHVDAMFRVIVSKQTFIVKNFQLSKFLSIIEMKSFIYYVFDIKKTLCEIHKKCNDLFSWNQNLLIENWNTQQFFAIFEKKNQWLWIFHEIEIVRNVCYKQIVQFTKKFCQQKKQCRDFKNKKFVVKNWWKNQRLLIM